MKKNFGIILVIDSSNLLQRNAREKLKSMVGVNLKLALKDALLGERFSHTTFILCLHDYRNEKSLVFNQLSNAYPGVPIIIIGDASDVASTKNLVTFLVHKDRLSADTLLLALQEIDNNFLINHGRPSVQLTGLVKSRDMGMANVYQAMELVAPTDYTVLIFGETGTGKESIAKMIHNASRRKSRPFVAIDCGCLSSELAATTLFGAVKGAYTDAQEDRYGAFQQAEGGTLFLDEIGNLPYDVQIKLLRVLQEKKVRKVGAISEFATDIRIIAATNELLKSNVANKHFRDDLFYRLNEFEIVLPPLRERPADIPIMANAFLKQAAFSLGKGNLSFTEEALQLLCNYNWPGNIRELRNVVKRVSLLANECGRITSAMLPEELLEHQKTTIHKWENDRLKNAIEKAEQERILEALRSAKFNKRKAAEILNIHRKTLYNKIRSFNLGL